MSNSQKNFLSIRSKLIAAVAMLLVASFMVVSSTYAWFTLSTAPEVTGITTQIGANGNLEIALYKGLTVENGTGLTNKTASNLTWGNIIDLDDESYGLSTIILKPSTLAVSPNGEKIMINTEMPLITPTYGSDGRVQKVEANGFYGSYNGSGFVKKDVISDDSANSGYGVRALGTVSTMTGQQLQYNTSSTAVKTHLNSAAYLAESSLSVNGPALVNLIVDAAIDKNITYTIDKLAPIYGMIDTLNGVPAQLEGAVKNYILLVMSKAMETATDAAFKTTLNQFNDQWDDIFDQLTADTVTSAETVPGTVTITIPAVGEGASTTEDITVPPMVKPVVWAYITISENLDTANAAYELVATTKETANFDDLKNILASLMNVTAISVNGSGYDALINLPMETPSDAGERADGEPPRSKMEWAGDLLATGSVQMKLSENSGVYADISKVTKNLNANFNTDKNFAPKGIAMPNYPVRIYTELTPGQMSVLNPSDIQKPADKGADANAVISDTYAYVLDFAFRTNAANSNLLLQQDASDRIYGTNTDTTAETWGGGSYMEFKASANSGFTATNIAENLVDNIRIVFADTITGEILAGAGLDSSALTYDSEGNVVVSGVDGSFKVPVVLCSVEIDENGYLEFGDFLDENSQAITALGQNSETYISVYVYLDGLTTTNASVAALAEISANGKLNLQFKSDAPLVPMEYSDLKNQNQGTQNP